MGVRAISPEEREQERRTDAVVAEMDLATEPAPARRRQWYGIVLSRDPSYLNEMLAMIAPQVDEVHKTNDGQSALVIMREGPAIGNIDL